MVIIKPVPFSGPADSDVIYAATAPANTPPAAPAAPVIASVSNSVNDWQVTIAPGSGGGPVNAFELERSVGAGNFADVAGALYRNGATSYTLSPPATAPVYGDVYTFKVIAEGPGGAAASAPSDAYPIDAPAPGFNENGPAWQVSTSLDGRSVAVYVDWSQYPFDNNAYPGNPAQAPLGFHAYFYPLDGENNAIDPAAPSGEIIAGASGSAMDAWGSISSLAPGGYEYVIRLYNDAGESPDLASNVGTVTVTAGSGDNGTPTFSYSPDPNYANVFDLSATDNQDNYEYSPDGTNWYNVGSLYSIALAPGTSGELRLYGQDDNGDYGYSAPQGFTNAETVAPPTNLAAALSVNSNTPRVTLTWDPLTPVDSTDSGVSVQGVQIERSGDNGVTYQLISATLFAGDVGAAGSYVDYPPSEDTKYIYRIRQLITMADPVVAPGYSDYSNTVTVTTPPNAPVFSYGNTLDFTAMDTQIDVDWTDTSNREASTTIEASTTSDFSGAVVSGSAPADAENYVLTGLTPNTAYYIRAQTVGADQVTSAWATTSYRTAALPTITIADLCDASELAPDGTPGTGYFVFTRSDYNPYDPNAADPAPAMTVNYTVDSDATDAHPNPATPGYEYAALSGGTISFPDGVYRVVLPVTPKEINQVEGNTTVTLTLTSEAGFAVGSTPQTATMTIVNTDADTVTLNPPVLGVDDPTTIPVSVTNYYGRPATNVAVDVTQYDPNFATIPTTPVTTDATGTGYIPATALEYGTMSELLDVVANASQASATTSPVGSVCAPLVAEGIAPEAVVNGVPGAELTGSDRKAGIYVPESHADTAQQSAASYWAPFVVHVANTMTEYPLTLKFPDVLTVNTNSDGSGQVISSGELLYGVQNGEVLYVKATALTANATISLARPGSINSKPFDSLKVTPFNLVGPNDVPQYGTYSYAVGYPKNVTPPSQSGWLSATGGVMTPGTYPNGQPIPNAAQVQWGAGPIVGTAIYRATANFSWGLNVNIVQIVVGPPLGAAEFLAGTVYDAGTGQIPNSNNPVIFKRILSGGPGISYEVNITLNGPNGNQGIGAITAGFMQNLTVAQYQATYGTEGQPATYVTGTATYYDDLNRKVDPKTIVGKTFWDTLDPPLRENPLYDRAAVFHGPKSAAIGAGATNVGHIFTSDSPNVYIPKAWGKPNTAAQNIVSLNVHYDFDLYVVAQTSEAAKPPVGIYVAEADAKWAFDASGNVLQRGNFPWIPTSPPGIAIPLNGFIPIISGLNPLTGDVKTPDGNPVQFNYAQNNHLALT